MTPINAIHEQAPGTAASDHSDKSKLLQRTDDLLLLSAIARGNDVLKTSVWITLPPLLAVALWWMLFGFAAVHP
jgi:hypothetical protein